jgi:hypothetical protein
MAYPFRVVAQGLDRADPPSAVMWGKRWGEERRRRAAAGVATKNLPRFQGRNAEAAGPRDIRMDSLEPRFLLSADLMPFTVDMSYYSTNEYLLKYENLTQSIQVSDAASGVLIDQRLAQDIDYIRVVGTDGDDSLVIDFTEGFLFPLDLRFEGGLGADRLSLHGGVFDTMLVAASGGEAGSITAQHSGGATQEISFTGVSLIGDTTGAAKRIFVDKTGEGQVLRLRDAGTADDGLSAIDAAAVNYEFLAPSASMTIELGAGDDNVIIESIDPALVGKLTLDGGEGANTVTGPPLPEVTWHVTGPDAGHVAGVSFIRVGTLLGAADYEDTFIVHGDGSLSGLIHGGDGGFDTLVLEGGTFDSITYVATGPHSGVIDRDDDRLVFDGLEPVEFNSAVADITVTLSKISDNARMSETGGVITIAPVGLLSTFETATINVKPTNSLTINMGDDAGVELLSSVPFLSGDVLEIVSVNLTGVALIVNGEAGRDTVRFTGASTFGDLTVNAEFIEIASGATVTAAAVTLNAEAESTGRIGGTDDDDEDSFFDFIGQTLDGVYVAVPRAAIEIDGTLIATGTVAMTATATANVSVTQMELGSLGATISVIVPSARISMDGATIQGSSLDAKSAVKVTLDAQDQADADDTDTTSDAAIAVAVVVSNAETVAAGVSNLRVSGAVSLTAETDLTVKSTADGSGGSAGGTLAVTVVHPTTRAAVIGDATIGALGGDTPDSIAVGATLKSGIETTAISTAGGADASDAGTNRSEQQLASNDAETANGDVTFAGAVVVLDYRPITEALLTTSGTVTTAGLLSLTATATEMIAAKADGSTTGGSGNGVGAAVTIGIVNGTTQAILGGSGARTAGSVALSATLDAGDGYSFEAVAGAGDGAKTGVAGALVIGVIETSVVAEVADGATFNLAGSNLSLAASSTTQSQAIAVPKSTGAASDFGIGASVAVLVTENTTRAALADNASVAGVTDLAITATGTHGAEVKAEAGANATGGSALGGAVAIAVIDDSTVADSGSGGAQTLGGNLTLSAVHAGETSITADATVLGANAAVGAAIVVGVVDHRANSTLRRDVTAAGAVALSATTTASSAAVAKASATGTDQTKEQDKGNTTADQQRDQQLALANKKSGGTDTADQSASTSDGSVSVAAALAVNIANGVARASIDDGVAVMAEGTVGVRAAANMDARAEADGSAKTTVSDTSGGSGTGTNIGAAIAINVADLTNEAVIGAGATVTGTGILVRADMADVSDDKTHRFGASSTSGASGGDLGVAGSFALNVADTTTRAVAGLDRADQDGAGATTLSVTGGSLQIVAESDTENAVTAGAVQDGATGDSVGVGASIAINVGDNTTLARMTSDATVANAASPGDVAITALAKHRMTTEAKGGSEGGTAVTPVVAIAVAQSDTRADVLAGAALNLGGGLTVQATQDSVTRTTADGGAKATSAAVGAALGLTIAEEEVSASLARDVTAGGVVLVAAESRSVSRTDAKASAKGAPAETGSTSSTGVNDQSNAQVGQANQRSGGTNTTSAPDASTSEGAVSVAAAIGINIADTTASATIAGTDSAPLIVQATGGVTVRTAANADALGTADGSAVTTADGTTVGAAVALNVSDVTNTASIDHAVVTGAGVAVEAGMAQREVGFQVATLPVVDIAADTIFVGEDITLATGTEVTYVNLNGFGTDIGGLSNGSSYFVIAEGDGLIKLASSAENAAAGTAIDLTSVGSGTDHRLIQLALAAPVTFDPAADRFAASIDATAPLVTGDAVRYEKGSGDAVGGLTDSATYFAIIGENGKLKLAESRADAFAGKAITLTGAGTDDGHKLIDTSHSTQVFAKAGAGGGKTGVAGAVGINISLGETAARLGDGAVIDAESGAVRVEAITGSTTVGRALPATNASGTSLGLGLSFGIAVADYDTSAVIAGDASVGDAGNVTVSAAGDHGTWAHARAGAASSADAGTAIGGAVALTVTLNETRAAIEAGDSAIGMTGELSVAAANGQVAATEADADTKGGSTGVGIAIAVAWVEDDTSALLARDIASDAQKAGKVSVTAVSGITAKTTASGSSEGAKSEDNGGKTADQESQSQTNFAGNRAGTQLSTPQPGAQTDSANSTAANQTGNPGGQGGNAEGATTQTQGGKVRVAGAIGATVLRPEVSAEIAPSVVVRTSDALSVRALNDIEAETQAIGLAFEDDAKTTVGAAVSINVAELEAAASIGADADIAAGSIVVEAGSSDGHTNALRTLSLAGSGSTQKGTTGGGGGSGDDGSTAVAGAAAVNVMVTSTRAEVGNSGQLSADSGDVSVIARQIAGVQAIAGGGALTLNQSQDSKSVGAAIGVNIIDGDTTASIGESTLVTASGDVTIAAEAAITPIEIIAPMLGETGIDVSAIAIGAAIGSGGDAGAGSAIVSVFTLSARALIGAGAEVTAGNDIHLRATNEINVLNFAGALALSKDAKGIGVGLDVLVIAATTETAVGTDPLAPTRLTAGGSILIEASSRQDVFSLSINVGAGDSKAAAGGAVVVVIVADTVARLGAIGVQEDLEATADGSVLVAAESRRAIDAAAGSLGVSLNDSSFGAAAAVVVVDDTTEAEIGDGARVTALGLGDAIQAADGTFEGDGAANTTAVRGVAVTATSFEDVLLVGIGAAGALGDDAVGLGLSVTIGVLLGATRARIGAGAEINDQNDGADAAQGVLLRAADKTKARSIVGGLAISGETGIGGAVSVFVITNDVVARAEGGNVLRAEGDVTVDARVAADIDALAISVAGTLASGSSGGNGGGGVGGTGVGGLSGADAGGGGNSSFAFAGAGSVVVNVVTNGARAVIGGGTVDAGGALSVTARDDSDIRGDAGGAAIAIATADSADAIAVAASIAVNIVDATVLAEVSDTVVSAAGATVDATNAAEIGTITIAGSAAVSNDSTAFGGAGSASVNFIDAETSARIAGGSVTTPGALSVTASEEFRIDADAGSAALALALDSQNQLSAIAIGAAVAANRINSATTAEIEGTTVSQSGPTTVAAVSSAVIDAFTLAIAGTLDTGSGDGAAFAGAGAGSGNFIGSDVTARIANATLANAGAVGVSAADESLITTLAGSGAITITAGDGNNVGIGLGLSVTVNEIAGGASALIVDSAVNASGGLTLTALDDAEIRANAFGIALSVAQSGGGNAISGAATGAVAVNTITGGAEAAIRESDPAAGRVLTSSGPISLMAEDLSVIQASSTAANLSLSLGDSGTAASGTIGVGVAVNTIRNNVLAEIDGASVTTSAGGATLTAESEADISAVAVSASLGVTTSSSGTTAAFSVDVPLALNDVANRVEALIGGGGSLTVPGAVMLSATDDTTIFASVIAASFTGSINTGSEASLAFGAVVTASDNVVENVTRAMVVDASVSAGLGGFSANAVSIAEIDALAIAASVTLSVGSGGMSVSGAGTGAGVGNTIANVIEAGLGTGTTLATAGPVTITAIDDADIECMIMAIPLIVYPSHASQFDCVMEPSVVVKVGSPTPGLLAESLADRGGRVQAGQVIARLTDDVERATVDQIAAQASNRAEIEAQAARVRLSESRLVRTHDLASRGITAHEKLDQMRTEAEVAQLELAMAETRHQIAGLELERARRIAEQRIIRSPIDGLVLERRLFRGEYVHQEAHVFVIAAVDPLFVETYLPVRHFRDVAEGMLARVRPLEPIGGELEGKVVTVDRVFDAASGTFGVRLKVANSDGLLPAGHLYAAVE